MSRDGRFWEDGRLAVVIGFALLVQDVFAAQLGSSWLAAVATGIAVFVALAVLPGSPPPGE